VLRSGGGGGSGFCIGGRGVCVKEGADIAVGYMHSDLKTDLQTSEA
jgi:hypothetical protein